MMATRLLRPAALTPVLLLAVSCVSSRPPATPSPQDKAAPATRPRIETADQLPRHLYPVPTPARALLEDSARFAALARQLAADLRGDLAAYDIQDRATLKSYYGTFSDLALLRGEYGTAVAYRDSIRAIEDKPGLKLTTGLVERALAASARASSTTLDTARFRTELRREIEALPYAQAQSELAALRRYLDVTSERSVIGSALTEIETAARSGSVPRDVAQRLVAARVRIDRIAPVESIVEDELARTLAAHGALKPDIWAARDVSLERRPGLTPVVIGLWDSGTDVSLYPQQLFTNRREVPDNGKDDDGNGYVDDVHGIAHDLDGRRTVGLLMPISLTAAELTEFGSLATGLWDLRARLQTPEADAVRRKLAAITPADMRSLQQKSAEYGVYAHGTHVAGIAVRGNPAARLLVARIGAHDGNTSFMRPPPAPTLEHARAFAQELRETIAYFRQHGVRVVNMSWHFGPQRYEASLAANNVGTPEERQKLARQIYDIGASALHEAMARAPEILFVAAAGNENADNRFGEFAPTIFDLPNLITVGAVDQAGDETNFTSYGKVDVYANSFHTQTRDPGGKVVPFTGTSSSAPEVVNLAAKLLALKPKLTVAELRRAIVESADEKTIGPGNTIRLLNPKAAFQSLMGR